MNDRRLNPANIDREEQKAIVKEAIKEWLDDKYKVLGKWTLQGIAAMFLAALGYFLATHGWLGS